MNPSVRYRLVGVVMAALFCVFTIGVPVVLASCPMMAQGGSSARLSCCPDSFDRSHESLSAYKNSSCCATKIAATRNTQEFVPSCADLHNTTGAADAPATALLPATTPVVLCLTATRAADTPPAAPPVLFSILYATLLI